MLAWPNHGGAYMALILVSDLDEPQVAHVRAWLEGAGFTSRTVNPRAATVTSGSLVLVVSEHAGEPDAPVERFAVDAKAAGCRLVQVEVGRASDGANWSTAHSLAELSEALFKPVIEDLLRLSTVKDRPSSLDDERTEVGVAELADEEPPNATAQTTAFISYRSPDSRVMNQVRAVLVEHGYNVWWDKDKKSIPASSFWPSSVEDGIRRCDALVVLISPSVLHKPSEMGAELYLARDKQKKIVPVYVRPMNRLPDGWEFILAGTQHVALYDDFNAGIEKICHALGPAVVEPSPTGLRAKVGRGVRRAKRFANNPDVREGARNVGLAVIAVAAAAAAGAGASASQGNKRQRGTYADQMQRLLNESFEEVEFARQFDPEFQGRFQNLLGRVEATVPPKKFAQRHQEIVNSMRQFGRQYDEVVRRGLAGDGSGLEMALQRINRDWKRMLQSNLEWLQAAAAAGMFSDDD